MALLPKGSLATPPALMAGLQQSPPVAGWTRPEPGGLSLILTGPDISPLTGGGGERPRAWGPRSGPEISRSTRQLCHNML